MMKTNVKLEIARWARETLAPYAQAHGEQHAASIDGPHHWLLTTPDVSLILSDQALLSPADRSLSCLLDVWSSEGKKVLSVTWEPERPWEPPRIVRLVFGPWREALDKFVNAPL